MRFLKQPIQTCFARIVLLNERRKILARIGALFISALLMGATVTVSATPGFATEKSDMRPRAPRNVEILNQRSVSLSSFEIASGDAEGRTIARTTLPIAAGGKFHLALRGAKGCDFIARWRFEDSKDEARVDLCNDPRVILMD